MKIGWKHGLWLARTVLLFGGLCVLAGGMLSAWRGETRKVRLVDDPSAPIGMRQFRLEGDLFAFQGVTTDRYATGEPRQFHAALTLFVGPTFQTSRKEVLTVNGPLDWKGWRLYLMDGGETLSPMGAVISFAEVEARKDPGARVVFVGYGLLVLAALLWVLCGRHAS